MPASTTLLALLAVLIAPVDAPAAPLAVASSPMQAAKAPSAMRSGSFDLGVVTDLRRVGVQGITLLAVTPGGAAERMGLRAGDRVVMVNGVRLDVGLSPAATLRSAVASRDGEVEIEAVRDGRLVSVRGRADPGAGPPVAGPAAQCGYLTTLGPTPRVSQDLFDATITRIDGRSTPLRQVNRHRVEAGRRVLVVRESIPAMHFDSTQLLRRELLHSRQGARAYKVLIVDVEPGVRYSVAAELLRDRMDTDSIRGNAYWQPVVWREIAEACQ